MADCTRTYVFTLTKYTIPQWLAPVFALVCQRQSCIRGCHVAQAGYEHTISLYPILFHALAMSVFSSVIAPFGGFFASGLKRAFLIKACLLIRAVGVCRFVAGLQ